MTIEWNTESEQNETLNNEDSEPKKPQVKKKNNNETDIESAIKGLVSAVDGTELSLSVTPELSREKE